MADETRAEQLKREILAEMRDHGADAIAGRLAEALSELERVSAMLGSHGQTLSHLQLPFVRDAVKGGAMLDALTVSADWGLSVTDGFYSIERTNENLPFRWTGSLPFFRFALAVRRDRPLKGELSLIRTGGRSDLASTSLRLVGTRGPIGTKVDAVGTLLVHAFELPVDDLAGASTELQFHQNVWFPTDESTLDKRSLGVPFHKLTLQPVP